MKTSIGTFDTATKSISVVFEHAGVVHERTVNACLNAKGKYDAEATADRISQVALGVEKKIDMGVITNAPPVEVSAPPAE